MVDLASQHDTPLFVMDEEHIRNQCRSYVEAFSKRIDNFEVIYASKAFVSLAMCQLVDQEGLSIDVSSGGELFTAIKSGFSAERIIMHGNNKTPTELSLALDTGIGRIVVDSFDELELLESMAGERSMRQDILLRLTPGVKAYTHDYLETGVVESKFGFGLKDGLALNAAKKALEMKNLSLKGFHAHIGSQIFVLHSYRRAIEILMQFIRQVKEETGFVCEQFNAGGGLGIKYEASDEPSTVDEYAEVVTGNVLKWAEELDVVVPRIAIEPGRSIVGNSGVTIYTVGTIKELPGVVTYIAVDGGMSDNLRPMLYGAVYQAIIANKARKKEEFDVRVVGKHCESGDVLVQEAKVPKPERGDILMTPATGAYGYVMSNNYNRQPRPAVVWVKGGKARVIVKRETYEDVVRLDEQ